MQPWHWCFTTPSSTSIRNGLQSLTSTMNQHCLGLLGSITTPTPVPAGPAGTRTGLPSRNKRAQTPGLGLLLVLISFYGLTDCISSCPDRSHHEATTPLMRCHDSNIHWSHSHPTGCKRNVSDSTRAQMIDAIVWALCMFLLCSFIATSNYYLGSE